MENCEEKLKKLKDDVFELNKFIDELTSEDMKFFISNRDKVAEVFNLIEKEFSDAKYCPVPAVKVEGECKDTSLLLEPVVGRYVPSEDIFYEIKVLIDAGAISKLKDKTQELEKYLDSVVGGYECKIDTSHDGAPPPLIFSKKEPASKPVSSPHIEDLEIEADAEIMAEEGRYKQLAKKKFRNETSKRRNWYKECMSEKLKGKKKGMDRVEWREFFKQAAKECKESNPYPKKQ